ncbi:PqqD family protein [Listeria grandensis]|uniref:PqqD family protein n=1 Tax=Listeria grandensis TaxID=1494963 RepID=A0A7X0Y482_9LIST|nr:PqqD family protein [Listeria grandensis]MBC1936710.1 PqqD family protein [Listeria grandensis]
MLVSKNPFVKYRAIQGKMFLVYKNRAYCFKETEEFIWSMIDGKNSFEYMVKAIIEKYNIAESVAEEDLHNFLNSLLNANLIKNN